MIFITNDNNETIIKANVETENNKRVINKIIIRNDVIPQCGLYLNNCVLDNNIDSIRTTIDSIFFADIMKYFDITYLYTYRDSMAGYKHKTATILRPMKFNNDPILNVRRKNKNVYIIDNNGGRIIRISKSNGLHLVTHSIKKPYIGDFREFGADFLNINISIRTINEVQLKMVNIAFKRYKLHDIKKDGPSYSFVFSLLV